MSCKVAIDFKVRHSEMERSPPRRRSAMPWTQSRRVANGRTCLAHASVRMAPRARSNIVFLRRRRSRALSLGRRDRLRAGTATSAFIHHEIVPRIRKLPEAQTRSSDLFHDITSQHLLAGTQRGDICRYDTHVARKSVAEWKQIVSSGNKNGIGAIEKGFHEQYVRTRHDIIQRSRSLSLLSILRPASLAA